MATKDTKKLDQPELPTKEVAAAETPAPNPDISTNAPAGFDTRVGQSRGDGWLQKTPGQVVVGRLLGRFAMKSQRNTDGSVRTFFQVKVLEGSYHVVDGKPVPGVKAAAKDQVTKEPTNLVLGVGQVLNVDEHKALEDLGGYCRNGGVYDIWLRYVSQDKIPGRGNKTFWTVEGPNLKTLKAPTHAPGPDPYEGGSGDDSNSSDTEIPF